MFNVLCAESNVKYMYEDYTYNAMCMADAITFSGPEQTPILATEEDVRWWCDFERACDDIEEAAFVSGISVYHAECELGIVWDDYGASINKLAEYFGVSGIG